MLHNFRVLTWSMTLRLPPGVVVTCPVSTFPGQRFTIEKTNKTPLSSRDEGLLFLHGLESNPGSSLQTEEEAGLP